MRVRSRWSTSILGVGLALTLLATACGGDDDASDSDGDGNNTEQPTGDPVYGGELRMGLEAETTGGWCLPEGQLAAGGIQVAMQIFDPLAAYDADFKAQPYLAKSIEPNETFDSWVITLREGVVFHDDTPVDAAAVKMNMDLWRGDQATIEATGRQPLLLPFVFDNVETVTVTDPLTLTVTTSTPWPAFPEFLATGRFGIAAPSQIDGTSAEDCAENLIGSGPFSLVNWERNEQLELERNENYWRTDAEGNTLPYLDSLVFVPIDGGPNRYDALEGGTLNAGQFNNQFNFENIEANPDFNLFEDTEGHREVSYGIVNVRAGAALADKETRLMLGRAIDRSVLNDINSAGVWDQADQPFDTGVPGYIDGLEVLEYDPDTAADFFADNPLSIKVSYATDPTTKAIAEDVKRQAESVGVEVEIDEKDQATLINQAIGGNFDVLLWRNHPGADPDTQRVWWYGGSPVNFGGISDPELDALLDAGRVETDEAARTQIWEDVSQRFADEGYNQWNWYSRWAIGATTDVVGVTDYTIPDENGAPGVEGAGYNWGWSYLSETWISS